MVATGEQRIAARFAALKAEKRAGFITFLTAGDPNMETSLEVLARCDCIAAAGGCGGGLAAECAGG